MRTIFKLLKWGMLFWAPWVMAQGESPEGWIRVVNAVAQGSGRMQVEIDGKKLHPKGYGFGAVTGSVSLPTGTRNVKFFRDGVVSGSVRITVLPNKILLLIPFGEKVASTGVASVDWAIKVLHFPVDENGSGRDLTWVSVSKRPELNVEIQALDGRWSAIYLKRLRLAQSVISQMRGYVPLRVGSEKMSSIPVVAQGRSVVVFYDDESGGLRSVSFYQPRLLDAE